MTGALVIDQLPISGKQGAVRVSLTDGGHVLDLRVCSPISATSGVLAPTSRAVTLAADHLPALIRALQDAERQASELGMIGRGSG